MQGRNKKIRTADFGCNPFEGYFNKAKGSDAIWSS